MTKDGAGDPRDALTPAPGMKILVTGSHGLVGSALLPYLRQKGHEVLALVRSQAKPGELQWNPTGDTVDLSPATGLEAVIHLAGENLASGRWTAQRKAAIRESRVQGTRLLAEAISQMPGRPRVLLSASAVGYYGDRGTQVLTEESPAGSGFLAEVCREWEGATTPAISAGIRVAWLRFGIILSGKGGALKRMLPAFKLGVGGPLGKGDQFWSWIALDDVLAAIHYVLSQKELTGPVNVVSPQALTNREFRRALGHALGRPSLLAAPAFALRLLLGPMADEALLASARVEPRKLLAAGFKFRLPTLHAALNSII